MRTEDAFLALSGIQHYLFCPRQWALIHIEGLWEANYLTVTGDLVHERAHDESLKERYEDKLVVRGLAVKSRRLEIVGQCDVVEFYREPGGFPLYGEEGQWGAYPVEYKRGSSKLHDADRAQLCAQALCLEEMFCTHIATGALFYHATRSRETVEFNDELRLTVEQAVEGMKALEERAHTPKPRLRPCCKSCSFHDSCLAKVTSKKTAVNYVRSHVGDD
jgi:CRISPR-associated exonuclease Cas4